MIVNNSIHHADEHCNDKKQVLFDASRVVRMLDPVANAQDREEENSKSNAIGERAVIGFDHAFDFTSIMIREANKSN